ncbi:MAG: DUF4405 domain-containing protein [Deltaproteobacteria bacterium]|nr:DUF4405 domain-containing protein [Deltaproteobacteria bacterium]
MTKRTEINFWIDLISLFVMLGLATTGGLLYFVLPPGTGHTHFLFGLGRHDIGRIHFYLAVAGIILLVLHVYLHWTWICCFIGKAFGNAVPSQKKRTTWGLVTLCGTIVLLVGGIYWASSKVECIVVPPDERELHDHRLMRRGRNTALKQNGDRETAVSEQKPLPRNRSSDHADSPAIDTSAIRAKVQADCPIGAAINGKTTLAQAARSCGLSVEKINEYLNLPANVVGRERLGRLKRRYGLSLDEVRRLACRE